MSEFLVVIPEGWTQVDVTASGMSLEVIRAASSQTMDEMLRIAGIITAEQSVQEFRILDENSFFIRVL
jgi:hypothetical protein